MQRLRRLLFSRDTLKTELLGTPVKDLGLRIPGSILEACIAKALDDCRLFTVELEPYFYLSDSYGCVAGTTNIGLGFWDADPLLREVVKETRRVLRDENDILILLKHEIGHAFCYAHKLYRLKEFRETFNVEGHFFNTYPQDNRYRADPWSPNYVNPDGDYYAQKHPDDDFAETFATYVDPSESWRERYKVRNGALRKILFVRRAIRAYRGKRNYASDNGRNLHVPASEIGATVAEFFHVSGRRYVFGPNGYVDHDLKEVFRAAGRLQKPTLPAASLLNRHRLFIEKTVAAQIGLRDARPVRDILDKVAARLRALRLVYLEAEEERTLAALASFVTLKALAFKMFGTITLPA